ncbi:signal peptidase I [Virgibacillus halophilus]|uniref:Signal peptidase I n=1 Tax=Tigheibacillus halophilus TaxID=361280 RepID=A0ABU5C528_9BACI|nr:signal peptidase I [Virgibacillus halophilus]
MWEWTKPLLIAVVLAFVIRAFFFEPSLVKGASMQPTLKDEDRLIIMKIGEPKRFDVVVFHATDEENYVKRVIGLPGDHIAYKKDTLYINGEPYDEPYLADYKEKVMDGNPLTYSFTLKDTAVGEQVVPEGHLFVMGDNRRVSRDSRSIGAIPMEKVIGTTKIVYYPFSEMKILGN